jgi:radical SAM/Cys-rich protein
MHDMLPRLEQTDFPPISRDGISTLQVNLGYTCNQSCLHCHVNAGPKRREQMDQETLELVLRVAQTRNMDTLDLTGGAPELNPGFRQLVRDAHKAGLHVIDRCNLTILSEPKQEDLAAFLAAHQVEIMASMPCYLEENVDSQRGAGVYARSIEGLRQLNALGYGVDGSGLILNLVYNPTGPFLPPSQQVLESDYKSRLREQHGIVFNRLYSITNMPIARFGSTLVSRGEFDDYMTLLKQSFQPGNLNGVMCRSLVSVDYRGYLYDCDFNQMLGQGIRVQSRHIHLRDLLSQDLDGFPIFIADHCYGCTAGQGSSCGGAL